jgi:hypothetical protein
MRIDSGRFWRLRGLLGKVSMRDWNGCISELIDEMLMTDLFGKFKTLADKRFASTTRVRIRVMDQGTPPIPSQGPFSPGTINVTLIPKVPICISLKMIPYC